MAKMKNATLPLNGAKILFLANGDVYSKVSI